MSPEDQKKIEDEVKNAPIPKDLGIKIGSPRAVWWDQVKINLEKDIFSSKEKIIDLTPKMPDEREEVEQFLTPPQETHLDNVDYLRIIKRP